MQNPSVRIRGRTYGPEEIDQLGELAESIEPWMATILRAEHVSALFGSGLSIAVAALAGTKAAGMDATVSGIRDLDRVEECAKLSAADIGRSGPNIEDKVRTLLELIGGLEVLGDEKELKKVELALEAMLSDFYASVLAGEKALREAHVSGTAAKAVESLAGLLLAVSSRPASRERANIFTTNYDRLIEWGADRAGLRVIDRFVGSLEPLFRSSRIEIDMHYSPPGIRGEPRYLDGIFRLTKLHGSLDWRASKRDVTRIPLGFGAEAKALADAVSKDDHVLIYPRPAKDVETSEFPYSELLRDFSAAVCRPNSSLLTYGYGFGDDHINRVIEDMLSVPSTHLVVISYDDANGRISNWIETVKRDSQISWLIGEQFSSLDSLVTDFLPIPPLATLEAQEMRVEGQRAKVSDVAESKPAPSNA